MRLNKRSRRLVVAATVLVSLGVSVPAANAAAAPAKPQPQSSVAVTSAAGRVIDGQLGPAVYQTTAPQPRALPRQAVYTGTPHTMGPWETWWATLTCPAGMRVSGGGESNSSPGDVTLVETLAVDGGNTWRVRARNNSANRPTFKVHAVCWSDLDNYAIIETKAEVPPGATGHVQTGFCPGPGSSIGGGGYADTVFNTVVKHSLAAALSWSFGIQNNDSVRHSVFAQAICGRHYGTTHPGPWGQWVTLGPGQYGSAYISCGGSLPMLYSGGGYTTDAIMTDLYPEGNGYRMYARNPTAHDTNIEVEAMCGR